MAQDFVFYSSQTEEITLPHEFIFVYLVFHWGYIVEKVLPKVEGSEKGGFKPTAHYGKCYVSMNKTLVGMEKSAGAVNRRYSVNKVFLF